jgi:hypothetical protein
VEKKLRINFLPVLGELSPFTVYRLPRIADSERPGGAFCTHFRNEHEENSSIPYWVRFKPAADFLEHRVEGQAGIQLTKRALFHGLTESARNTLKTDAYQIRDDSFYLEMAFDFDVHEEGVEQLSVQTYFLGATKQFGLVLDFHFAKRDSVAFSRRVQQLSLSLDKSFKRNLDCYLDRRNKIVKFLRERIATFSNIQLPGSDSKLELAKNFAEIPYKRLQAKTFLFSELHESKSQFSGLKQFGPLSDAPIPPHLLFVFLERDRGSARTLAMALQGKSKDNRYNFPGFESLFKTPISVDGSPIVLESLGRPNFQAALEQIKERKDTKPGLIPVFVLPASDDNGYVMLKSLFTSAQIPTQVCTTDLIADDYGLKWAIANIALQIFCKAGGCPWKVRPTTDRTLIMGISQSHKKQIAGNGSVIEKYFAFSVMTDNSGLFQRLEVLGDCSEEEEYLEKLRANLARILKQEANAFKQVVIHTSFRLKWREMEAIESIVKEASQESSGLSCRFAVVKVNHKTRFFGFNNEVNSLVPYEGTVASLGGGEYLVWFEGIFPDKTTVNKAFAGPTHVQFLRQSSDDKIADGAVLQDLVNLSGANWRGFNAKSAPVSVFYCHLVADLVHSFHLQGLPLPTVQDLKPWFL